MKRADLSFRRRTSVGQPLPKDHEEKVNRFRKFIIDESINVPPNNLRNIKKVPILFDMVLREQLISKKRCHQNRLQWS